MSMLAEGLARCGALSADTLASVVAFEGLTGPALAVHPLVVREPGQVPWYVVKQALALDPPAGVVDELLASVAPTVVAARADEVQSPRLIRELDHIAAGSSASARQAARWVQLRIGDLALREELVVALAPHAGRGPSAQMLTWLAAAAACAHLLAGLVEQVPSTLRGTVARLADVAAAGGCPVEVFAREVNAWVGDEGVADWMATTAVWPTWPMLVRSTGLEQVAEAALAASQEGDVLVQIVRHPHLVGTRVQEQVFAQLAQGPAGPAAAREVLRDRAVAAATWSPRAVIQWLAAGHESHEDVAFAWAVVRHLVDGASWGMREVGSVGTLAAVELACMDGPDGPVGREALAWARQKAARRDVNAVNGELFVQLSRVADAVHTGAGIGALPVGALGLVWDELDEPTWVSRLVGEFLAGVPGVDDPVFVQGLLAHGEGFTGTFDDLVTVAAAIAA